MHQYLKAIGFNNIHTRKDLKKLLSETEENFTHQTVVSYRQGEDFCEFQKEYGQGIGISVCGELTEDEKFERAYYFPYFTGSGITTYADITVERKIEKEQYVGLCEDAKVGISLIFTIQNGIEYMRERKAGFVEGVQTSVTFSGLALSGMILLPVVKNEQQIQWEKAASDNRRELMNAARNGDQTAIETLTLDDMDIYSKMSKRLKNEDVFTIVDTYFMPYGAECDIYSIMGEILAVRCSDETLYTGWTNDLEKRINAHNAGKGAKYTKNRRPVELAYYEEFATKEEAMSREYAIKQLTRRKKEELIKKGHPGIQFGTGLLQKR